jgi:uncharacterized protein involved in outer membrane biogenesis
MPKPIKALLFSIVVIPLFLLLALSAFLFFNDANSFKSDIESQAKQHAGINLKIAGDLKWSLIPTGIDINDLSILDQDEKHFASAKQIFAQLEFFSIFSGSPKVNNILLDGLNIELVQTSETEANWLNILPPPEQGQQQANSSSERADITQAEPKDPAGDKGSINFLVESVQLANINVHFKSQVQNIDLQLRPLNVTISDIALGQKVPLRMDLSVTEQANQLQLDMNLESLITVSENLSTISIENLTSVYTIAANATGKQALTVRLESNIEIDTAAEEININRLSVVTDQLKLDSQFSIKNYKKALEVSGSLDIPKTSLKKALLKLGIQLPDMQLNEALELFAFSTDINLVNNQLELSKLKLSLDESQWQGKLGLGIETKAIVAKITGDTLNLDHYLPPRPESDSPENDSSVNDSSENKPDENNPAASPSLDTLPAEKQPEQNTALLPLDTLRELNLDIEFIQQQLIVNKLETNQLSMKLTANKGLVNLHKLNGKLYEGEFNINSVIDARTDTPTYNSTQKITALELGPISEALELQDKQQFGAISGTLNLSAEQFANGNTAKKLKSSATANATFEILTGQLEGLSLNAYACEGLALINRESVSTRDWPATTPFNTLKGEAKLKQQILSTQFDIITAGIHADSQGSIDLEEQTLNINAGLKVIGELGHTACRVNEKLKELIIPVNCNGAFTTAPAELCGLDNSRLIESGKKAAVKEGKRKINKELDRALEKHLGEDSKLKDTAKKLFKGLF